MTLFDELVAALQPTMRSVAPFILTRLLLRAGVIDRATMTVDEFRSVFPIVEAGLRESMAPGDLAAALGRIDDVMRRHQLTGASSR